MNSSSPAPGSEQKRQPKLTAKALANKMEILQKERKAKVNLIEAIVKEVDELMQSSDNAETIQTHLHNVPALYDEASQLHDAVIPFLPPEEQDKQNAWFSKIRKHKITFIENTSKWLSDINGQLQTVQLHEDVVSASTQPLTPDVEAPAVNNDNVNCVSEHREGEVGSSGVVDNVGPSDSASMVAFGLAEKRNTVGSTCGSTTSSTASARVIAEADLAALLARQNLLKKKHAMEEQEAQLKRAFEEQEAQFKKQREQLDLEIEIAASAAKVDSLKVSGTSRVSASRADGMNAYLEKTRQTVSHVLDADAEPFVPVPVRQPFQHTSEQQSRSHLQDARPKQPRPTLVDAQPNAKNVGLQF